MSCICANACERRPRRPVASLAAVLVALLMQLAAPALLLPHLQAFHGASVAGASHDDAGMPAGCAACHPGDHAPTGKPAPHDHAHCTVCQLAMQVQQGGLSAWLDALPPVGTLPICGPAAVPLAPDCTPSVRLPDICGPPIR